MIEELNNQEIVEETPEVIEEVQETPEVSEQEVPVEPEQTPEERNLVRLRELREIAERERDELKQQLAQMQQQYTGGYQAQQFQPKQQNYAPSQDHLNPDDLVEGRHLSAYDKKIAEINNKVAQQNAMLMAQQQMGNLRTKYQDFDAVVSTDNVRLLQERYPDIAKSIANSTDIEAVGKAAYEIIKRFGIHEEDAYRESKAVAQRNTHKPRPTSSTSPLGQASSFDKYTYSRDELEQARKEMEDSIMRA